MNNVNGLPPFKRLCVTIGNLPSSYVESMSYYECLMWLCKYLKETVIPAINNNAEAVKEIQDWIENIDLQDEVDKKLDEMAESGQLQEIISEYLNSKAIFGFNTVQDMKSATNLIDGSYARTCGNTTFNDGNGALYKIRTVDNDDVVDGENIIAMTTSNTLVAEKITNVYESKVDILEANDLSEMVTFGDSWSMNNYPYIEDQNNMWNKIVSKRLNLNLHNYAVSGAGFTITNKTILSQINTAIADTNLNKNKVKYVIYFGGINDLNLGTWSTLSDVETAMDTCFNALKTNFPKSNIIIAGINCYHHVFNGSSHTTTSCIEFRNLLLKKAQEYGFAFIDTTPFLLSQPDTLNVGGFGDGHPTDLGQRLIGSKMLSAINGTPYSPIKDGLTNYIYNPLNPTYNGNITRILINGKPKSSNLLNCEIVMAVNSTTAITSVQTYTFNELKPCLPTRGTLYQGTIPVGSFSVVGDGTINTLFSGNLANTNPVIGYFDIEV